MDKLKALELAIEDAEYWARQTGEGNYLTQADALKLLLDEINGVEDND